MTQISKPLVTIKTVTIWDIILIATVVISVILQIRFRSSSPIEGTEYQIYRNDSLILQNSFSIDTITIYSEERDSSRVAISDSSLHVFHSTCRSKICVHSGEITNAGDEIICLPFQLIFKISGSGGSDADIIAR